MPPDVNNTFNDDNDDSAAINNIFKESSDRELMLFNNIDHVDYHGDYHEETMPMNNTINDNDYEDTMPIDNIDHDTSMAINNTVYDYNYEESMPVGNIDYGNDQNNYVQYQGGEESEDIMNERRQVDHKGIGNVTTKKPYLKSLGQSSIQNYSLHNWAKSLPTRKKSGEGFGKERGKLYKLARKKPSARKSLKKKAKISNVAQGQDYISKRNFVNSNVPTSQGYTGSSSGELLSYKSSSDCANSLKASNATLR